MTEANAQTRPLIERTAPDTIRLERMLDALIDRLADELENGVGIMKLRGFPVNRYDEDDLRRVYFGLGTHLGTPVFQNRSGELMRAGWGCGFFDMDKPLRDFSQRELDDLLHKEPTKIKVEGINLTYEGLIPKIQKSMLSKDVDAMQPHVRAFVDRLFHAIADEDEGVDLASPGLGDQDLYFGLAAPIDYNGDGRADILWRNPATGQTYSGTTTISAGAPTPSISISPCSASASRNRGNSRGGR